MGVSGLRWKHTTFRAACEMPSSSSSSRGPAFIFRSRHLRGVIAAVLLAVPVLTRGQPAAEPDAFGKVFRCKPGPWGDLEYYQVHLEMPDWMINSVAKPDPVTTWYFPGGTEASVRALFQKAGLSAPLQNYLLDATRLTVQDELLTVCPPVPDVIAMTPVQRAVIYNELAKSELNDNHSKPITITNGDPDTWFGQSGLRPELIEMTKKLTYMQGQVLCFSDPAIVIGMARNKSEARDIFRVLNRSSSLVLRLNLKSSPDFDQVVRYWTAEGRNKDIEAMLRSAAETEGNDELDATHLLPLLPRRYLYSYYSGEIPMYGTLPNCHWTSLNFFNATPLDYHRDPRLATLHVNEDYTPVPEPYRLGDVLMFVTGGTFPLHSCVYIADDIVYTKNGQSATCPWNLMKLSDVKRGYSRTHAINVQGYRLKTAVEQVGTGG
jgi:hypothetical protein